MAINNDIDKGEGSGAGTGSGMATTPAQTKWGLIIAIGLGVLVIAGGVFIYFVK